MPSTFDAASNNCHLFRSIFFNPDTGEYLGEGDKYKNLKLADTLEIIAEVGVDDFYTGQLASMLIEDLKQAGSNITQEDLESFRLSLSNAEFD